MCLCLPFLQVSLLHIIHPRCFSFFRNSSSMLPGQHFGLPVEDVCLSVISDCESLAGIKVMVSI